MPRRKRAALSTPTTTPSSLPADIPPATRMAALAWSAQGYLSSLQTTSAYSPVPRNHTSNRTAQESAAPIIYGTERDLHPGSIHNQSFLLHAWYLHPASPYRQDRPPMPRERRLGPLSSTSLGHSEAPSRQSAPTSRPPCSAVSFAIFHFCANEWYRRLLINLKW